MAVVIAPPASDLAVEIAPLASEEAVERAPPASEVTELMMLPRFCGMAREVEE